MNIRASEVQPPALVYLRGHTGRIERQIWWQPASDLENHCRGRILAWHRLDAGEGHLPFATLAKLYPPPALPDSTE